MSSKENPANLSTDKEVARWVKQLQEAEARLKELLGDKADVLLVEGRKTSLLREARKEILAGHHAQTQKEVQHSEVVMENAQRIAHFGSWELDFENPEDVTANPLRWSDEVFRLFGYEPGEIQVTTETFYQAVHPEDRLMVVEAVNLALKGSKSYVIDHRIILPDGTIRFVHEEAQIIKDALSGKPLRMLGIVQDITERMQKEEALRLSEARFASAFEHASIGMALVSPLGRWLKVNLALCDLLGYTAEELHEMTFQDITHPDDLEEDINYVQRLLAGEIHHYQLEKRYFHKLGRIVTILLSVSVVRDSDGEPLYFISQIQDITERKESELRLQRLNRLYSVLSKINETIVRAGDEKTLCERVCQIAVEQGELRMAWIGEVHATNKQIIPFAFAGADDGYLANLKVTVEEGPLSKGPAGSAIREGRPDVSQNITTDPRMAIWREAALKRGYQSIAAFPLNLGPDRQGVFVLYASELNFFSQEEIDLLIAVSDNISFALESIRKEKSRLEAEEGLRKSEELYRLLFFDNPHPMWVYDVETLKFLAVNSAAEVQYGYTEAEFMVMTVRDIRPVEDLARFDDMLRSLPEGKYQTVALHRKKNGEIIDVEIFSDSVILGDRPARLVACANITERRDYERKLAEQAALLDEARDAIIVRDMDRTILFWNKGAERIYGWTEDEALNKKATELFYSNKEEFEQAMRTLVEKDSWSGEINQVTKTGEQVIVESRWTLIRNELGQPRAVLCINTDITERKKMESHFLRAQRMESIGTLAGGIAHDLNNLLAPIIMGVDLLRHFGIEGASSRVVDDIERSARRGSSLVRQVLSFARGVESARVSILLKDIIAEIVSIIHNTFPKDIILETKISDEALCVEGDPTQINQVLLNLCLNARDSMPAGGRITLDVHTFVVDDQYQNAQRGIAAGEYACIEVIDTGCGIPKENLEKIFDPFFTTKELTKGTGLGLATALGIVRGHGGFLNVYSEMNRGTSFKVYLPTHTSGLKIEEPAAKYEDWPRGNGEWILLIDDENSILTVTGQILEAFGYNVITAEHGAKGLALFADNRDKIALVLTDMMMPVMDGPSTIVALRELKPEIKVIAASGLNTNANSARAVEAGVQHFLAKPYTTGAMLSAIRDVLKKTNEPVP